MKKHLIITILLFIFLIFYFNSNIIFAKTITEKDFFNSYKELTSKPIKITNSKDGTSIDSTIDWSSYKLVKNDNQIVFNSDKNEKISTIDCNISSEKASFLIQVLPEFSSNLNFVKEFSMFSFLSVANIQKTDLEIAYSYFSETVKKQLTANNALTSLNYTITDDVFNLSQKINSNFGIEVNLEIKLENWSKVNNVEKTYTLKILESEDNNSGANNTGTTKPNTSKDNSSSHKENLPQTGSSLVNISILIITIFVCLVLFKKYNNYKDID